MCGNRLTSLSPEEESAIRERRELERKVAKLEAELAEIKLIRADLCTTKSDGTIEFVDQSEKIAKLERKLEKAEAALRFYADRSNTNHVENIAREQYCPEVGTFVTDDDFESDNGPDWIGSFSGKRAREYFAELNAKEEK